MLEKLRYMVGGPDEGRRLDRFLRLRLPSLPPKSVRSALEAGEVFVCGERARKGRALRAGDEVTVVRIAEKADWLPVPGDLPGASVLHADEYVAVLDKPAGVHTEPHRPLERGTLAGYLLWRYPQVVECSDDPGLTLLSRLDNETSGAVPAALSAEAFAFLAREREQGRILKHYICLVAGLLEEETSLAFVLETEGGGKVRVRTDRMEPDPRYWTGVSPIRAMGDRTLVRAVLSKGKRHQVRAHLAAAGFPIVGDRRYGTAAGESGGEAGAVEPGATRLMLHAAEVRFTHPKTGTLLAVRSPLPEPFGPI